MTYSEIEDLAKRYRASAIERSFDGQDCIMVVQEKQSENGQGLELWSNGIFISDRETGWDIGFAQTEKIEKLNSNDLKKILVIWLNEPSDEILRNYVAT